MSHPDQPLSQARLHLADPAWRRSSAMALLGAAGLAALAALALSAAVILGPPAAASPRQPALSAHLGLS